MLTIFEPIPTFDTYETYLGYQSETCLFFDIETTGLSSVNSIAFLIGAVFLENGTWQFAQWMAQHPEDEPALLQAFFDAAQNRETLIHFNGTTFDLPFLKQRAKIHNLEHSLDQKSSLDLYQKFRPLKKKLGLERMNQISLEQFLGWPRLDRLTGKHMISLFQKYIASQEKGLCDLLLLHNHDDLLGMTVLLRLSAYDMLFDGLFKTVRATVNEENLILTLTLHVALPINLLLSSTWTSKSSIQKPAPDTSLSTPQCTLTTSGTQTILTVPMYHGELRYFFPDYKNYYYLPLEDQAIHKSVAAFVDKEYRVPAKPANCYTKKSGCFLPQPEELFSPAFKVSYESKESYFDCTKEFLTNTESLKQYTDILLHTFQ